MCVEYDGLSFGRYLKTRRLEKAIRLEAISRKTHVTVDMLLLLEKEAYARLPAQVYVKGFIREYANAVGIDAEDALRRYLTDYQAYQKAETTPGLRFRALQPGRQRTMMAGIALAVGLAVSVCGIGFLTDTPSLAPNSFDGSSRRDTAGPRVAPGENTALEPSDTGRVAKPLTLDVTVSEKTWLKVIVDGNIPDIYHLVPEDRLVLQAASGFNLLIGSASGVKLLLDGKPVNVSGRAGQMVNIQLP